MAHAFKIMVTDPLPETFDAGTVLILNATNTILKHLYSAATSTGTDLLFKKSDGTTIRTINQVSSGTDFKIINSSGITIATFTLNTTEVNTGTGSQIFVANIITYTDYDDIPTNKLKHVISFVPDFGTKIDSNEILLEINTLDSGGTDNITTEETTEADVDTLVLNGTDSSSTNAGSNLILNLAAMDGRHKLVPENFSDGAENHLVLETATDVTTGGHYHEPVGIHHIDEDGHTEEEHREIALWDYKLQQLLVIERANY